MGTRLPGTTVESRSMSIAIDGPVACGKSSVGRLLANKLGARFLDTGSMYRAMTWAAIQRGVVLEDEEALGRLASDVSIEVLFGGNGSMLVDGADITPHLRSEEVEKGVSLVSKAIGVRGAMVAQQRAVAQEGPIVVVGRDIGTVVLPDATLKVYLDAPVRVRALRRHAERTSTGESPDIDQLTSQLSLRDQIDSERANSPLRVAEDSLVVDTDDLTVDEVVERIAAAISIS